MKSGNKFEKYKEKYLNDLATSQIKNERKHRKIKFVKYIEENGNNYCVCPYCSYKETLTKGQTLQINRIAVEIMLGKSFNVDYYYEDRVFYVNCPGCSKQLISLHPRIE